jgi:4-carboxymuconolactone decarboxylase
VLSQAQETLLRQLSIGDEALLASTLVPPTSALCERTAALIRLAALILKDSSLASYQRSVNAALDSGASVDEMLALLPLLAQLAGSTAVVNAAPKLAMALGYDVEHGLEELAR